MSKRQLLLDFIEKYKKLPPQGSKQWLEDRKFNIGGSEISTITGQNPYNKIRNLIENHLGIVTFNGNINTYWGSTIEGLVVSIFEDKMNCKVYETGSLPGVIECQKYSPDGLVYLDYIDKLVLLEIKSASRRVATGSVPTMYKPQIYTGLDTIKIADFAIFIDACFRRCGLDTFEFSETYDKEIHSDKPLGVPLSLCAICIYEKNYSTDYDKIKNKYGKDINGWIDGGKCCKDDLETFLKDILCKKLNVFNSHTVDDAKYINSIIESCDNFVDANDFNRIAILPLKLFKFETVTINRGDWKKKYKFETPEDREKSYVQIYANKINETVNIIKDLDDLSRDEQIEKIEDMFSTIPKEVRAEMMQSLFE